MTVSPSTRQAVIDWEPVLTETGGGDWMRREIHRMCQALESALHDLALYDDR